MCGRHDRDGFQCHVIAELAAACIDRREMFLDEWSGLVADVQQYIFQAEPFHLMVNGAGDDIPWRQVTAFIKRLHERLAVRQQQPATFSAYRFGDQKGFCFRVIEASGMKLVELQVGDPAAGTPGHGNTITTRGVRIAGIEVDFAGATGCKDHAAGCEGFNVILSPVEDIGPQAAILLVAKLGAGDQIDGNMMFKQCNVRTLSGLRYQGFFNGPSRGIGAVQHPACRVAAFPGEMKFMLPVFAGPAGEGNAEVKQMANGVRGVLNGKADGLRIVQAGARDQGVLDMCLERVFRVGDRGNSALGIQGATLLQAAFGQDGNPQLCWQLKGETQAGATASDD